MSAHDTHARTHKQVEECWRQGPAAVGTGLVSPRIVAEEKASGGYEQAHHDGGR